MISYELAKKLKDAGFPNYEEDWIDEVGFVLIHPTLSELIEACGEDFGHLDRKEDGTFIAYPTSEKLKERKMWMLCRGEAEEAIANLWLELNKKNE